MKRKVLLFVLLGAIAVLAPVLAVFAQSSKPADSTYTGVGVSSSSACSTGFTQSSASGSCCSPATTCTTCKAAKTSSSSDKNEKIVEELTAILMETKSTETFLVTAMTLGKMGAVAKPALPAIIRNAERLEMFEDLFNSKASDPDRTGVQGVLDAIEMIVDKKASSKGRACCGVQPNVCPAPTSATSYATPNLCFPTPPPCLPGPGPLPQAPLPAPVAAPAVSDPPALQATPPAPN
jgi:hypothetical protein